MALNISYFYGADNSSGQCYGSLASSVAYTVTGSSASAGAIPAGATIARLTAGETCRVSNNGVPASATNGVYLTADTTIDLEIVGNQPLLAITA